MVDIKDKSGLSIKKKKVRKPLRKPVKGLKTKAIEGFVTGKEAKAADDIARVGIPRDPKKAKQFRRKSGRALFKDPRNRDVHEMSVENAVTTPESAEEVSFVEELADRVEMLKMDWAIQYPSLSPREYLLNVKGYGENRVKKLMERAPSDEWDKKRDYVADKVSQNLLTRHIDLVGKMNDKYVDGAKLGLAGALELAYRGVPIIDKKESEKQKKCIIHYRRPLYPKEHEQVANALKTYQFIHRTAFGLNKDDGGSIQAIKQLQARIERANFVQNNVQVNVNPKEDADDPVKQLEKLSYDDILLFVEHKRAILEKRGEVEEGLYSNG